MVSSGKHSKNVSFLFSLQWPICPNIEHSWSSVFDLSEKMSSHVRLRLLPSTRCLFDEPVQLKVAGLRSRQVVTIRATSTDEREVVFGSSATYRADDGGEVDLNRDPSLNGSYVGVQPMGLLQSLKADTLHKYFFKNKALNPHVVKFSVHEQEADGRILAEETNERFLMGDGVSRDPVKEGNIRGVLFTPPGTVCGFPLRSIHYHYSGPPFFFLFFF